MSFIVFLAVGFFSGLIGGAGMGGGTILIPALTLFFSVSQHTAQAINLVAFIPMAAAALKVHSKNKLIKYKNILYIIIPAALMAALGSLLARGMDAKSLQKLFGAFLILLSAVSLFFKKNQKSD